MNKDIKKIFDSVKMTEKRFWELVDIADWKEMSKYSRPDYDSATLMYLKKLDADEGIEFRRTVDKMWNVLNKFVGERNPAQGGDDSHSDFLYHIIGLGKKEFYANLNDYSLMEKRGKDRDFRESFGYCLPYISDWDNKYGRISELIKQSKKEMVQSINAKDKLSKADKEAYNESAKDACPYCKGKELIKHEMEADSESAFQTVECINCGKSWNEIFKYNGMEELV